MEFFIANASIIGWVYIIGMILCLTVYLFYDRVYIFWGEKAGKRATNNAYQLRSPSKMFGIALVSSIFWPIVLPAMILGIVLVFILFYFFDCL